MTSARQDLRQKLLNILGSNEHITSVSPVVSMNTLYSDQLQKTNSCYSSIDTARRDATAIVVLSDSNTNPGGVEDDDDDDSSNEHDDLIIQQNLNDNNHQGSETDCWGEDSSSTSSEEDVTTTVMKFNRVQSSMPQHSSVIKNRNHIGQHQSSSCRKSTRQKKHSVDNITRGRPHCSDNNSSSSDEKDDDDIQIIGGSNGSNGCATNAAEKRVFSPAFRKRNKAATHRKRVKQNSLKTATLKYFKTTNHHVNGSSNSTTVPSSNIIDLTNVSCSDDDHQNTATTATLSISSHPQVNTVPSRKWQSKGSFDSVRLKDANIESQSYETYDSFEEDLGEEAELVKSGIKQYSFFSSNDCAILEQMIDDQVVNKINTFKSCTVDRAPLRNKYFFGEGYTYGTQMKRKGPGMEELYPKGFVDDIPEWIVKLVIKPLEKAGIIPSNFVNSCVINDYLAGGCIISHIDPKQLFDRPIYTISLMSDSALSFGVKFTFKPIRCSEPIYRVPLKRGCITSLR